MFGAPRVSARYDISLVPLSIDDIPIHLADHPICVAWSTSDAVLVTEPSSASSATGAAGAAAADSASSSSSRPLLLFASFGREVMRHTDTIFFRGGRPVPREHTLKAQAVQQQGGGGGRRRTLAKAKVDLAAEIVGGGGSAEAAAAGGSVAAPPQSIEREVVLWLPAVGGGGGGVSLRAQLRAECVAVKGAVATPALQPVLPPLTPTASTTARPSPPAFALSSSSEGGSGSGSAGSSPRYSWAAAAPRAAPDHLHRRPLSCPSGDAGELLSAAAAASADADDDAPATTTTTTTTTAPSSQQHLAATSAPLAAGAVRFSAWAFGGSLGAIRTEGRAAQDILRELESGGEAAAADDETASSAATTNSSKARRLALGLLREREALHAERTRWRLRADDAERRAEAALASKRLMAERLAVVEAEVETLGDSEVVAALVASKTQAAVLALELEALKGELAAALRQREENKAESAAA